MYFFHEPSHVTNAKAQMSCDHPESLVTPQRMRVPFVLHALC